MQLLRYARAATDHLRVVHHLGQQMIHFVQTYLAFTTIDVLGPLWQTMSEDIRGAKTIDEVVTLHEIFLSKAVSGCLMLDLEVSLCTAATGPREGRRRLVGRQRGVLEMMPKSTELPSRVARRSSAAW